MQPTRPTSTARRLLPAVLLTGGGGAFLAGMHPTPGLPSDNVALLVPASLVPSSTEPNISAGDQSTTTVPLGAPSSDSTATVPPESVPISPVAATVIIAASAEIVPISTVPAAPACGGAVAGPVVDTRWGPVQVAAAVSPDGALICTVSAPITPTDHRKSVRINDRAVPLLNDHAMFTQGAVFDSVSGATITSKAYKQSLQAILDGQRG